MWESGKLNDINAKKYGIDDGYTYEYAKDIVIIDKNGFGVNIRCQLIMLMIEGKVFAEEFDTDPMLINYLFRNSNINNPLCGAVISEIVG